MGVVVPVVVDFEGVVLVVDGNKTDVLFAGCSLATTIPMSAVAPVATTKDARVRRRNITLARRLLSAELWIVGRLIGSTRGLTHRHQT
jgi:hypothetical protein